MWLELAERELGAQAEKQADGKALPHCPLPGGGMGSEEEVPTGQGESAIINLGGDLRHGDRAALNARPGTVSLFLWVSDGGCFLGGR